MNILRRANLLLALSMVASFYSEGFTQHALEHAFPNLTFLRPVDFQSPDDGSDRIFVVEQQGVIKVFKNSADVAAAQTFLDIRNRVNDSDNEEGLLGLAFHPNFASNPYFFVNYTAANPRRTVISRFTISTSDPNAADASSELVILEFQQPFSNHNGGQIAFGPDGYLYIATGDGGQGGDPFGNGQNLKTLLGALLRIDVDNPAQGHNYGIPADNPFATNMQGFRPEIFAYGLRNPWRFSFDPETKWLWLADVGQNRIEEIDLIGSGKNYGWNVMEGNECFNPSTGCDTTGLELPIWQYDHSEGRSITGGYVYRGKGVPELQGAYIYADFITGKIWALRYDKTGPPQNELLLDTHLNISSFGTDQNQELYLCAFDGKIYRFKPTVTGIMKEGLLPKKFKLLGNYPNPFNPETTIQFQTQADALIRLDIFDVNGRLVRTLVHQFLSKGTHSVTWDGRNQRGQPQPSGLYLYRLQMGSAASQGRRMVLLR